MLQIELSTEALFKSNCPQTVKSLYFTLWASTAGADGAELHVRDMGRFITYQFKSKTGTYTVYFFYYCITETTQIVSSSCITQYYFELVSEILSPSHLRCSGYEKQFPVCQFPWRLAEDHGAGVSLAVKEKRKSEMLQHSDGLIRLVEYTPDHKIQKKYIMFPFLVSDH